MLLQQHSLASLRTPRSLFFAGVTVSTLITTLIIVRRIRNLTRPAYPPPQSLAAGAFHSVKLHITKDGRVRHVHFFVPPDVGSHSNNGNDQPPKLIIAYHGSAENGASFRANSLEYGCDIEAMARAKKGVRYVIAYPDGFQGNWNDSRKLASYPAKTLNVDDIGFTKAIIEHAAKMYGTSLTGVFALGYSNGGQFVYRLALELGSQTFAACAVHCANLPTWDNSDANPLQGDCMPVIILNGTRDPLNPYDGGLVAAFNLGPIKFKSRGTVLSSDASVDYLGFRFMANGRDVRLRIDSMRQMSEEEETRLIPADTSKNVREWIEDTPAGSRSVAKLITMVGEGHIIPVPGGRTRLFVLGPSVHKVHGVREVLDFFEQF